MSPGLCCVPESVQCLQVSAGFPRLCCVPRSVQCPQVSAVSPRLCCVPGSVQCPQAVNSRSLGSNFTSAEVQAHTWSHGDKTVPGTRSCSQAGPDTDTTYHHHDHHFVTFLPFCPPPRSGDEGPVSQAVIYSSDSAIWAFPSAISNKGIRILRSIHWDSFSEKLFPRKNSPLTQTLNDPCWCFQPFTHIPRARSGVVCPSWFSQHVSLGLDLIPHKQLSLTEL